MDVIQLTYRKIPKMLAVAGSQRTVKKKLECDIASDIWGLRDSQ